MVLDDFLSRVAQAPDAIAVQDGALRLSYLELAGHASGLAARLTRRGVQPDDVVAVYADRSAELVVAELAVLLAGAAYLPLDPAHPAARTSEVLALSGAAAVVSTGPLLSGGAPLGDDPEVVDLAQLPPDPPAAPARPDDATLAYVIFTSGSTGRPKGVGVSHGSLKNLMRWREVAYPLNPQDRTTLLCSPGFDVAVWDTWPTLAAGGTLVVPPAEVRTSPADLAVWLADEQITATFLPTPLAEAVLGERWPSHAVLRLMVTGGSALQRGMPPGLPFTLVNLYGPAECTVGVTTTPVLPGGPLPPPIGVPIDGVRCYVLDGLEPVPDGEPGEMCLAGACVARGYLGDPAGTAKSFVPDITIPGQRMYRTGDKVRRRRRRILRVPRQARRSGQDPRVPDRAGRGGRGTAAAPGGPGVLRGRRAIRYRRTAPDRLRRLRRHARRADRVRRRTAAQLHGARRDRDAARAAADAQRQGGPRRAARARPGGRRAGRGGRGAAHADRGRGGRHHGPAARGRGGRRR